MDRKLVIIKNEDAVIRVFDAYMIINSDKEEVIFSYIHIKELYLHQKINIMPYKLIKLSNFFKVFLIDHHGNILAHIEPVS